MDPKIQIKAAAYSRVSTLLKGQSLQNQIEPIRTFAADRGYQLISEYSDEGISGATERRKGLDEMLVDARKGKFKVLIVMEISRLARDLRHLLNLLHSLDELGVSVISMREGITDGPMSRALLAMIGVLMGVERDLIRERIKTALAVKKMTAERTGNGWKTGRPTKLTQDLAVQILKLRNDDLLSIRQIALRLQVSKSLVQRVVSIKVEK